LHQEFNLGLYDYGFRWYDPAIARFVSVDPLAEKFPYLTTYQYASNTPIQAVDLDGLEAFIIHGTTERRSGPRFTREARRELTRIAGNTKSDQSFGWKAPLLNRSIARRSAAKRLVRHIATTRKRMIENREISPDEGISIIGYSHGGNVGIQATDMIGDALGDKVNLITVSTPAYNTDAQDALGGGLDSEDPRGSSGINSHTHIVHENDGVVNIAGGERTYNSSQTDNYVITDNQIKLDGSISSHVNLPTHPNLGNVLQYIPSMPSPPRPKNLDRVILNDENE